MYKIYSKHIRKCRERYARWMLDPAFAEKEKIRKRLSYRKRRDANLEAFRERERRWAKKKPQSKRIPEHQKARLEVRKAVMNGILIRPKRCPKCLSSKDRIQAHHHDYSKPLEIEWLCSRCHGKEHRLPKEPEGKERGK